MEGWRRYADGVVKTYNLYTMLLIPLYGGVPKAGWLKYDVFCGKPPLLSVISAQKSKKITKCA